MNIFEKRQGQMNDFHVYLYTETIHEFSHLLHYDDFKMIVIESLRYLVHSGLVKIYGYVPPWRDAKPHSPYLESGKNERQGNPNRQFCEIHCAPV